MKKHLRSLLVLGILFLSFSHASADDDTLEVPEDELARESVLPKFDRALSVRNRNVITAKRFELGGSAGWSLTEAFFNNTQYALQGTYHFSETHGANFAYVGWVGGVSSYSDQLKNFDLKFDKTPGPKTALLGNWQFAAYYGKMSFAKDAIMNLTLYSLLGLGMVDVGGEYAPTFTFGLGQKFYFSPNFSLRFDMRFLIYQGPDVVSKPHTFTEQQKASDFDKQTVFAPLLHAGMAFLF
ncbi:MAG: outer membrane beta-barrel domain-containing protein [Pseudobdellovibrionaceae bacterium]